MPAFHALFPVRDEADIVGECLRHMLTWADAVYVFDTGSVDETWEIVNECALREPRVKALRKQDVYYSENLLRGWLFHQARQHMREGDWFLRVDADEFHHVSPPDFVKTRLRPGETIAWHQYYNFCLLESEAAKMPDGARVMEDRRKSITERRRWWLPSVYSEPRLCRYRESMKWPSTVSFPYNAGFVAKARLPIRHYPQRDPLQLERRCRLRATMHGDPQRSAGSFEHWKSGEWREFLTPDDFEGLQLWRDGEDLPELRYTNHLAAWRKRLAQRFVHTFLVRHLDTRRPGWREGEDYPPAIPEAVVAALRNALGAR